MGYSEVYCQICGVSFNIGRIRKAGEPRSAAWNDSGFAGGGFVDSKHYTRRDCPPGCMVTLRKSEYSYGDFSEGYADPPVGTRSDGGVTFEGSPDDVFYPECPDPLPPNEIDTRFTGIGKTHILEHIAGPDCVGESWCGGGYNGNNISVDEMRGCNTLQCLVRKQSDWQPDADDEEFEREGQFFLSGLSDYMPSRDMDSPTVFPARHHCADPRAETYIWDLSDLDEYALPFHPTCLEVFKRASLRRSGKVDYAALQGWWQIDGIEDNYDEFPRDEAVDEAREQWWQHNFESEWLAANSCYVPGLRSVLDSVEHLDERAEFRSTGQGSVGDQPPTDIFSRLPQELRTMVVMDLDSSSIASLRIASRSFSPLPQAVFQALTLRERPWLWEAWSSLDYSFWSSVTAKELRDAADAGAEILKGASVPVTLLDANTTDWYGLFKRISVGLKDGQLKGLQNRRRIWKDCQEILDRAADYRRKGKM
ncbi:hypothetical protein AK830_g3373 [Neonectria ditissima]|uniref:F-box domain-containing protein n=1 Tax=Neonectria ditissima TaxID=78410 RepID=A0A0P7BC80_9HYPO|nr:hypothetical protein AK830_g3373 [Neonectria ditissima]